MKNAYRKFYLLLPVLAFCLLAAPARAQSVNITSPAGGALFQHTLGEAGITVSASASGVPDGGGVEFVLDMGTAQEVSARVSAVPYEALFSGVRLGEHTLDAFVLDETGERTAGHDRVERIGVGELIITIGDTVTSGDGDNMPEDDWSADGRNGPAIEGTGGGYQPVLNDLLTAARGYPHSVVNRGVKGERVSGGVARVREIAEEFPNAGTWLIGYGMFDVQKNLDSKVFQSNVQNIIQQIHAVNPDARVYLSRILYSDNSLFYTYHDRLGDLTRSMPDTYWGADLETLFQANHSSFNHDTGADGTWFRPGSPHLPNGTGYRKAAMLWKLALVDDAVRVCGGGVSNVGDTYADKINLAGVDNLGLSEENLLLICRMPSATPPAPEGTIFASPGCAFKVKLTGAADFNGGRVKVTVREQESPALTSGTGADSWDHLFLAHDSTLLSTARAPWPAKKKSCDLISAIDHPGQIATVADVAPPVTTYATSPEAPDGAGGCYYTDVKITLTAADGTGLPVATTKYKWDGGTELPYTGPVTVPAGTHTLYFYSVDGIGNREAVKSLEIKRAVPASVKITSPDNRAIFQQSEGVADIPVSFLAEGSTELLVQLVLDEGTPGEVSVLPGTSGSYIFRSVPSGEHTVDAYMVDAGGVRTTAHDNRYRIGVGDIIVTVGDSITYGEDDDIHTDDWSYDGRNGPVTDIWGTSYGGFQPILNDLLTAARGYPHSVINRGVSGDLASEGLARLDGILKEFPTAKTWLIAFGTNDSNHSISATSFKSTIQTIVNRIHAAVPGSKVYLPKVFYWPKSLVSQYHDKMGDIIRNTPGTYWGADLDTIFRGNHDLYYHRDYNTQEGTWFSTPNTHHPNGIGVQKMALLWKLALSDRAILVADGNEHSMGDTWADKVHVDNLHTIGLSEDNLFMICERPYANPPAPEGCKFVAPWSWEAKLTGDTDFNGGSLKIAIREERDTLTVTGATSWNQIWLTLGSTLLPTGRVVNVKNWRNEDLSATIDGPGQVAVVIKQ